jgi:hypothetical protein
LLILTAAMALAGAAAAQTPPASPASSGPPSPTPEHTAALHAKADALIAKTGHPELFENVTEGTYAGVRHKESGAVCTFAANDAAATIDLAQRKAEPGFDIYCRATHNDILETALTVVRLHDGTSLDRLYRTAGDALRAELSSAGKVTEAKGIFEDKKPIPGVIMAELPPSRTVRLSVLVRGVDIFARREVIEIGDWAVYSDFIVPRIPTLADPLGRLQAMADFKQIADAQKAAR